MGPEPVLPKRVADHRLEQFKPPVERNEFWVIFRSFLGVFCVISGHFESFCVIFKLFWVISCHSGSFSGNFGSFSCYFGYDPENKHTRQLISSDIPGRC